MPPGRDDDEPHGLFHPPQQPARQSRFASPSRPEKAKSTRHMTALGRATAIFAMVQATLWAGMSVVAAFTFRGIISTHKFSPGDVGDWSFEAMLTNLYFKKDAVLPFQVPEGMVTQRNMYRAMGATLGLNVLWLVTSIVMFEHFRHGRHGRHGARVRSVRAWALSTVAVTVLDVVLGAALVHDMLLLGDVANTPLNAFSQNLRTANKATATVLVIALRGVLVLLVNVGLMITLLHTFANVHEVKERSSSAASSATLREGAIDGYLFRNNDSSRMGVQNPVFVPDEAPTPFRAEDAARSNGSRHQVPIERPAPTEGKRLRRITSEELAHLSWMEEVDKHVDVHVHRECPGPGPAPGLHAGHNAPDYGFSYLHGPSANLPLPRVQINPNTPKFPVIPRPDYSPPTRRVPGGGVAHGVAHGVGARGGAAGTGTRPNRY